MNSQTKTSTVSRLKLTALVLCGLAGASAAGLANATNSEGDVPALSVKYDPQSLGNDGAVKALYGRIVAASREVCPDMAVGQRWVSDATVKCRKEAVARAVKQINNPRLAALYVTQVKNG